MKILKISGKNLASLAGEFCVDFETEPLASAGLFAISGPTGAGKSTLLDALCLALYDATPRLVKIVRNGSFLPDVGEETVSAQDPRTLLRRGAGEAWAEVDFLGNDDLRYRARWSVRRSRGKAAGGLQKSAMSLHRLPELIALGGTKTEVAGEIEQRIGLSFEQFTRAVLLAQNEFSAFLKTEENERGALLETLTGSAIYSAISKRAFERYKAEQVAMQQLTARLAHQTPLGSDARAALDIQSNEADTALAALDERKTWLEQQLRWHQEADKLGRNQALAEEALAAAQAELAQSAPRRRHLATVDAAQPARALVADCARLDLEVQQLEAAIAAGDSALQGALEMQKSAETALAAAGIELQAAEQAQRTAAPVLDNAKGLDAGIATLTPAHRKAADMLENARHALAQAAQARQAKSEELAATRAQHQAGAEWQVRHRRWEALAAQWPRWDTLFAQAAQSAALEADAAGALARSAEAKEQAAAAEAAGTAALADAAQKLQACEAARRQAAAALASFDGAQLRAQRQALEGKRDSLAGAEKIWTELAATRTRLEQAGEQARQLGATKDNAEAALAADLAQVDGLGAALAQAERSLKGAELACADSVVDLRATLAEGEPCPVCGSAEHPYQHGDAGAVLHQMLASLRAEVDRCRAALQENMSGQAARRAIIAASAGQLETSRRDAAALEAALDRSAAAWEAHALARAAPEPSSARQAWFADEQAALKAGSQQLDEAETAARIAASARDAAQQACDEAAAAHAHLQEAALAARAALAQAGAEHAALLERRTQAGDRLRALLDELDAAFTQEGQEADRADPFAAGGDALPDWQAAWRQDAAAFRAARAGEAAQWRAQTEQHAARSAQLGTLQAEAIAAEHRHEQLDQAQHTCAAEFARIDADIGARIAQRATLFEGQAVAEVERRLAAAIETARAAEASQQTLARQAVQAETRAREALVHTGARRASVLAAVQAAAQHRDAWLAGFAERHPDLDPLPDLDALDALLAHDGAWLAQERAALHAIDARAASAATVLAERREQLLQHQLAGVPEPGQSAASLAQALEQLLAERAAAHEAATALRLQIAQDNVKRESAEAMLAEIEKQQLVERRWGRMNELIGSADGKKFRNYAQQFTLDVLLGYANSHLGHLARRYRLERVINAGGPSLGLMVRDQDMGGEIRSVNSLSGGESFLVSLALALGLASLSSNRVRVESLFIDEGFGSLDSETLRVAMDALDGLQSLGRKVGVISHVQEMTERIATRILVQPTGGGTSSVSVA